MKLEDLRIRAVEPLYTPHHLKESLPVPDAVAATVADSRRGIADINRGSDRRFLAIVGPCSIHDPKEGLVYAQRLAQVAHEVKDVMLLVMRVYFEKPRTTVGWKGLVTDPNLDGSDDIAKGLRVARTFLLEVGGLGLPAANGVPRSHGAAVHRRPRLMGGDRRAHDRVADPPRDDQRALHAGRLQERHRRRVPVRARRHALGAAPAFVPRLVGGGTGQRHPHGGASATHLVLRGGRKARIATRQPSSRRSARWRRWTCTRGCWSTAATPTPTSRPRRRGGVWNEILSLHAEKEPRVLGAMLESFLETGRQDLVPNQPPSRACRSPTRALAGPRPRRCSGRRPSGCGSPGDPRPLAGGGLYLQGALRF